MLIICEIELIRIMLRLVYLSSYNWMLNNAITPLTMISLHCTETKYQTLCTSCEHRLCWHVARKKKAITLPAPKPKACNLCRDVIPQTDDYVLRCLFYILQIFRVAMNCLHTLLYLDNVMSAKLLLILILWSRKILIMKALPRI